MRTSWKMKKKTREEALKVETMERCEDEWSRATSFKDKKFVEH
jgi:hypothetical protein